MSVLTPVPPARTYTQRMTALGQANEIRIARAELKRSLARGDTTVIDVLLDTPREAVSWPVGQLLLHQRRWGVQRVRRLLLKAMVGEMRSVGALTERQRRELVGMLEAA